MSTPADRFRKALLRGLKASPFRAEAVFQIGGQAVPVADCQIEGGEYDPKMQDYDQVKKRRLTVMVLKMHLPERPDSQRDSVTCLGRDWQIDTVEGDEAVSPVWSIMCSAPI